MRLLSLAFSAAFVGCSATEGSEPAAAPASADPGATSGDASIVTDGATNDASDGQPDGGTTTPFGPPGTADTAFGTGGLATASVPFPTFTISKVLVQSDGKIILAGGVAGADGGDFLFIRLTTSGGMDPSFGTGGIATIDLYGRSDYFADAVLDGSSILAVGGGSTAPDVDRTITVLRLDASGKLDATFGTGGKVDAKKPTTFDVGSLRISVAPDGKVVAAGSFQLFRFSKNGIPDASFGTAGRVSTSLGAHLRAIVAPSDGSIFLAGDSPPLGIVHYKANGTLDDGWNVQDRTSFLFLHGPHLLTLAQAPQPGIGLAPIVSSRLFTAMSGSDYTYGDVGKGSVDMPHGDWLVAASLDKQARLVEVFEKRTIGKPPLVVTRTTSDFTGLDPTFGKAGRAELDAVQLVPVSVAHAPDGRIVITSAKGHLIRIFP